MPRMATPAAAPADAFNGAIFRSRRRRNTLDTE
jgi:hypothetical protein